MGKRISVLNESDSGRNLSFLDNATGVTMSRTEFVGKIENGECLNYHVRVIKGIKTPVSNPDSSEHNNLG